MCRLLLLFNTCNILKKIDSFLLQSIHENKFTPLLNNKVDSVNNKDGFGFAWYNNDIIHFYVQNKQVLVFLLMPNQMRQL